MIVDPECDSISLMKVSWRRMCLVEVVERNVPVEQIIGFSISTDCIYNRLSCTCINTVRTDKHVSSDRGTSNKLHVSIRLQWIVVSKLLWSRVG